MVTFHVGNRKGSKEYSEAFQLVDPIVQEHKSKLKPGEPQLNYCDRAVMVCSECVMFVMSFPVELGAYRMSSIK